jgi:hypothetical protein
VSEDRTGIPAEIKRRVLVEAGHRCAIPTCRYIEVEIHHIVPWAKSQDNSYGNLIALCANCHRRADRGEIDRKSLHLYKKNLSFIHDRFSNLEVDLLFELARFPAGSGAQWPEFNLLLIKRILEAGLVSARHNRSGGAAIFGMSITPLILMITPKGMEYVRSVSSSDITE